MTWREYLAEYKQTDSFIQCLQFVKQKRENGTTVYPVATDVFNAFKLCEFEDIKVVILGQDPYHGPGQAHGLCFSVPEGVPSPPSLKNIYKELHTDIGMNVPTHGNLTRWAEQGVFLLNTVLTVEQSQPNSHQGIGWEAFTDHVIDVINNYHDHVVFMLWGASAQKKRVKLNQTKHTILTAPHPSPLSAHRGFLGCKHFSQANAALVAHGQQAVSWELD